MDDEASLQRPPNWSQLTWEQKRKWRFDRWRESTRGLSFVSAEAEAAHKLRMNSLIAVYNVEEPDCVPIASAAGMLPLREAGLDYRTAIYDPQKAIDAVEQFNRKHADELDCFVSAAFRNIPAVALDILDLKTYAHPGHGMPADAPGFQFVEGEYMRADEYDALITDPSDFWLRTYFPRAYGIFEPLLQVDSVTTVTEIIQMPLWPLARRDVQGMLQRLLIAGKELATYLEIMDRERGEADIHGHLSMAPGCFAKAPFDTIGDTLRGTKGILLDMLRQPEKLLEALDLVADLTIGALLGSRAGQEELRVMFPLHKGADGWMSEQQFLTFYWPSLKKVLDATIAEGLLPSLFAEGSYNSRLDLVNEFPKGAVSWHFDRTDMAKAKEILGAKCSIEGNLPSSLLVAGSPDEVKAESRRLIEMCAPGGGYILAAGAVPEFPRLENLKAMAEAAREYGVYST